MGKKLQKRGKVLYREIVGPLLEKQQINNWGFSHNVGSKGEGWETDFAQYTSHLGPIHIDMDINAFREDKGGNPEMVRESQRRRFAPVEDVDAVIAADEAWRKGTVLPNPDLHDYNLVDASSASHGARIAPVGLETVD